jgi:hypothetical protein
MSTPSNIRLIADTQPGTDPRHPYYVRYDELDGDGHVLQYSLDEPLDAEDTDAAIAEIIAHFGGRVSAEDIDTTHA